MSVHFPPFHLRLSLVMYIPATLTNSRSEVIIYAQDVKGGMYFCPLL